MSEKLAFHLFHTVIRHGITMRIDNNCHTKGISTKLISHTNIYNVYTHRKVGVPDLLSKILYLLKMWANPLTMLN